MSAPETDPRLASEITRQKEIAINDNASFVRMIKACSIASLVFGIGAWFLVEPMDRDWGTACGFAFATWLTGLCLFCLFAPRRTPKCPQCCFSWEQEGGGWPTWKYCPGCGLEMNDDTGSQGKP